MENISTKEIKNFVSELFANGKSPLQSCGLSWEMLSEMERTHPEIVVKASVDAPVKKYAS
jgi:hypothetical protein